MKLLFASTLLLLATQATFAQFHYGIKGGVGLTGMDLNQPGISNSQYRLSYQAGFYGTQVMGKRFFSTTELLYANKGFRADAPPIAVGGSPQGHSVHLHYLSLPVFGGYSITERIFVMVGLEVSYLMAARTRVDSESNNTSFFWQEGFDYGLAAGAGYRINQRVNVDIRYVHGLRDVAPNNYRWADPQDPLATFDFRSQNRVFQLSLAYQLN
ncbi:porin family protein [Tunicatimonas pelagia]|uniref:porin family protein n=1 Tax=Tunicatimonas pelagia TaxID=931531 RepID=UPI0026666134|nr:porin family protein [Tunicatimonas pelagia]WKN45010.1 porin family protein [Tunicatimonas pelagia]